MTHLPAHQFVRTPAAWDRRTFLKASAVAASWPFLNLPRAAAADRQVITTNYPFQLGVASGDPTSDGVVLWTRLAPEPLIGGGMPPEDVLVHWQICKDEGLKQVVQQGTATASAELAHSVHVEVEGLEPDRVYWYQFKAAGETSPVGRTRTSPRSDVLLDRFRFAFASCQHFETGLYTAYQHMLREDLNLVIHLGDYIYEGKGTEGKVRKHVGPKLKTLDQYRNRHAQYKTDPHLQAVHAAFPWVVTWDDHEVENNYADALSQNAKIDPVDFLKQRAAAYQAYYEHMPLRKSALPTGPYMQLYRTIRIGRLAQFNVLDTRQYRTDQPCGDGTKTPCEETFHPSATLLGEKQEAWLLNQLSESPAVWNVLAQQVMMARVDRVPGDEFRISMDTWSGYDVARTRLLQECQNRKIANPVVLTGDIHTNWVNDLHVDFDNPAAVPVATEFVGTSISSSGDGPQKRADHDGVVAENPFVRFYNGERGYVSCTLTDKSWRADYQVLEYVSRPGAPLITRASFEVDAGRPGAHPA